MNSRSSQSPARAVGRWLLSVFKSQWLATVLIVPFSLMAVQTYISREDAREARRQSVNIERISKIQESGKALDISLAGYFQAIAELGLAQRKIVAPGTYVEKPITAAQLDVVKAREVARAALASHGADVEAMRGSLDNNSAKTYLGELAQVDKIIESPADIYDTSRNISVLGKMVQTRHQLVDNEMKKANT